MSFHDMYMAITRVEARALAIGRGHEGQMSIGLPELSDSAVQNLEEKGYTVSRGKRLGPPDVTPRYQYKNPCVRKIVDDVAAAAAGLPGMQT